MKAATKRLLGTSQGLIRQLKLNTYNFLGPGITYEQGYRNYGGRVV
jgi:hypothetical protein